MSLQRELTDRDNSQREAAQVYGYEENFKS